MGDFDMYDGFCCQYVVGVDVIVVFVDYWLVFEYFYFVVIEDVWVVMWWVVEYGCQVGVDFGCIVVVGDFVGGIIVVVIVQ